MAGLAAARTLVEAGRTVALVEARSRVGGRILTVREAGEVLELGAEFIHGRPPELWSLVEEAGLESYEIEGPTLRFENGRLSASPAVATPQEESVPVLDHLESYVGPDMPFAEYLDQQQVADDLRRSAIGYVEGFNAADHRVIGVQSLGMQQTAEDEIDGNRLFRIRDGYDRLPQYLCDRFVAAGGELHLNQLVERVEWNAGHVDVFASCPGGPVRHTARQAVITFPLGVLQQGAVEFVPVPPPVLEARRLRMGNARRFTLLFRENFWAGSAGGIGNRHDFSFLFSLESMPPVWWTPLPQTSNTITGWVGGPRAERLASVPEATLGDSACDVLAEIFAMRVDEIRSQLLGTYSHDWQPDGLSLGSYSYVPAGALDACSKMTSPADRTLFFAGEHTDTTGNWGTVHAALRSGIRAAQQVSRG